MASDFQEQYEQALDNAKEGEVTRVGMASIEDLLNVIGNTILNLEELGKPVTLEIQLIPNFEGDVPKITLEIKDLVSAYN